MDPDYIDDSFISEIDSNSEVLLLYFVIINNNVKLAFRPVVQVANSDHHP